MEVSESSVPDSEGSMEICTTGAVLPPSRGRPRVRAEWSLSSSKREQLIRQSIMRKRSRSEARHEHTLLKERTARNLYGTHCTDDSIIARAGSLPRCVGDENQNGARNQRVLETTELVRLLESCSSLRPTERPSSPSAKNE